MAKRVLVSWSGGKDSCMALYEIMQSGGYEVAALVTTVTRDYDRISMHGVRRSLLDRQASSLGLRLRLVEITKGATNDEYEATFGRALSDWRDHGCDAVVFGDLFLADIRAYRERLLSSLGMECVFPIWGEDTTKLAKRFISLGFKAAVVCLDPKALDASFAGRAIDGGFLADLPAGVDPCGENGEFHTFVFSGPLFKEEICVERGEVVTRDGFCFCDLLPCAEVPLS